MAEAALASRAIDGLHEIGRQDGIKKHGVTTEGLRLDFLALCANAGLHTSFGGCKNSARKAGEVRLFFHTLKSYLIRLFV